MSISKPLPLYHRIISAAVSIKERSAAVLNDRGVSIASVPSHEELSCLSLQPFVLPTPPSILQSLIDEGTRSDVAGKLASAYDRSILNLRVETEASFTKAWSQILYTPRYASLLPLEKLHSQLRASYTSVYLRKVENWEAEIRRRALVQQEALRQKSDLMSDYGSVKSSTGVRPSFNNDYLPVLEAFFVKEQFPTRADKMFLARKSGMEYRQIHVWFQNRRSRTKKLSSSSMTQSAQSNDETDIDDEPYENHSRSSSFTLVSEGDSFFWPAPPHAFPAKYPPNFDVVPDPFHCRFGDFSGFPKLAWTRTPTSCTIGQNDCDLPTLIEAFEKMNIGSEPAPVESNKVTRLWGSYAPRRRTGLDVTIPYTTHTYRAPLASLIRFPSRHNKLQPCPIFRPNWCDALPSTKGDLSKPSQGSRTDSDVIVEESSGVARDISPSVTSSRTRARTKGRKKVSGPPRRAPANRPYIRAEAPETLRSFNVQCVPPSILPPMSSAGEQGTRDSTNDSQSLSLGLGQQPSYSSSSGTSSGSQSPSTPTLDFSDESPFSFQTSLEASIDSSTIMTSKGLSEGVLSPLFLSTDFMLDHSLLNLPNENSNNFAFPHLDDINIFPPPAPYGSTLSTSIPFSFDFSTIAS